MHPEILTVNGVPYRILKLLGKGKGGYSYLAQDEDGNRFTLKQIHTSPVIITSSATSSPLNCGTISVCRTSAFLFRLCWQWIMTRNGC